MFKKILYPTDFSTFSNAVAETIINLRPAGVEEVVLLNVIDKRLFLQFPEVTEDVIKSMRASAKENISKIEKKFSGAGLKTISHVEIGIPFNQIVAFAKAEAISLIVMGSHGRSLVEEMLLGSTTENVLRHATVPLLVQKLNIDKSGDNIICSHRHDNPFEKILFATDFSESSMSVIPYIKQLKGAGTKEVIVTHVQDTSSIATQLLDKLPEFEEIDSGRLEEIATQIEGAGIGKVKAVLRDGVPFAEIERVADEEDVSMIVISSHGKTMLKEALIGSVSGRIVRKSTRPVLVIRKR